MLQGPEALRIAAWLLVGGGVVLVLMVGPTTFVSPAIWNGPQDVALRLIRKHSQVWRVANVGFVLATIVTLAGLFLVPGLVGERATWLGLVSAELYLLAAVPWLVVLAIRLRVTPAVASTFVSEGTVDPAFVPLERLGNALFPFFILIASASIIALGAAIVLGGSLSGPLGWVCIVAGVAMAGSFVIIGDFIPALVYVPTFVVGIALLLSS